MSIFNPARDRQILQILRKENPTCVVSPGFLEATVAIANNKVSYSFNFLQAGGNYTNDGGLNENDSFVAPQIGLFLAAALSTKEGAEPYVTFPDVQTLGAAFTTAADAANLEVIYKGKLKYTVDNAVLFENLPLLDFRQVPQMAAHTNAGQTGGSTYLNQTIAGQYDQGQGFVELSSWPIINGRSKSIFEVAFQNNDGIQVAAQTANYTMNLVLRARGFLVSGTGGKLASTTANILV